MLLLGQLFYFFAAFDLVHKNFSRLKTWDKVLFNYKGRVSGNIPRNFFLAFLIDKTTKPANVNVIAIRHRTFHHAEKCFNRGGNVCFVYTGFFSDFVNDVCFRHSLNIKVQNFSGGQIYFALPDLKMNIEKIDYQGDGQTIFL